MTIQSTVKELGLFDLFQILHLNRKTGRLIIHKGAEGKEAQVLFKEGNTCFAVVHERVPKTVGTILVEWGVLDEKATAKVEVLSKKYDGLIECLEGEGLVPPGHLKNFLETRIRESVYEIFKWEKGEYRFIEDDLDARQEILIPLNTENLIMEGARRIDEWSNISSKVSSRHSVFRFSSENGEDQRLNLKPREWEILSLVDGKRSVKDVNDAVGGDLFTTSKLIYGLIVMGVIEPVEGSDGGAPEGNKLDRIRKHIKKGMEFYNKLNLEKAAGEFEKALRIDQDCFDALRMLGEIFYKTDRLSEALMYITKARALMPDNEKSMFIKGYLHARMGEISQAVKEWGELMEKTNNPRVAKLVKNRISVAKKWDKVLQEY